MLRYTEYEINRFCTMCIYRLEKLSFLIVLTLTQVIKLKKYQRKDK